MLTKQVAEINTLQRLQLFCLCILLDILHAWQRTSKVVFLPLGRLPCTFLLEVPFRSSLQFHDAEITVDLQPTP
jgi:hypothetical protein